MHKSKKPFKTNEISIKRLQIFTFFTFCKLTPKPTHTQSQSRSRRQSQSIEPESQSQSQSRSREPEPEPEPSQAWLGLGLVWHGLAWLQLWRWVRVEVRVCLQNVKNVKDVKNVRIWSCFIDISFVL
jgi:hypothetical protein